MATAIDDQLHWIHEKKDATVAVLTISAHLVHLWAKGILQPKSSQIPKTHNKKALSRKTLMCQPKQWQLFLLFVSCHAQNRKSHAKKPLTNFPCVDITDLHLVLEPGR